MKRLSSWAMLTLALSLAGCVVPADDARRQQAAQLARQGQLTPMPVHTRLPVMVWGRLAPAGPVHVYIEGDGAAWRNSRQPSADPTPHNPVALKLAAEDQHASVLYLGRPCQYDPDPARGCHFTEWTRRRFAHADELEQAIRQRVPAGRPLVLVGFSGGANLAVQLATRLPGVSGLVTVAGNLDAAAFSRYHRLAEEEHGHNAGLLRRLKALPQLHYTGSRDAVIPPALTRRQLAPLGSSSCMSIKEVAGAGHTGPWRIDWTALAALQRACEPQ